MASEVGALQEAHLAPVTTLQFSNRGDFLASASLDGTIKLWGTESGALLRTLSHHTDWNLYLTADSKREHLASVTEDGLIRIWRLSDRSLVRTLGVPGRSVNAIAFSPQAASLFAACQDGTVRVWDLRRDGEAYSWEAHRGSAFSLASHPDDRVLVSGGADGIRMWDVSAGVSQRLHLEARDVRSLAVSPSGLLLASSEADESGQAVARIRQLSTGSLLQTVTGHDEGINAVAFSGDGKRLVVAGAEGVLTVWRLRDPLPERERGLQREHTLRGHSGAVQAVAFSPGDEWLYSGASDGVVHVWDLEDGSLQHPIDGQQAPVTGLVWLSEGLAAAGYGAADGAAIKIWEPHSGRRLAGFGWRLNWVSSLAVSPDSAWLVSGGDDGRVRVWDPLTGVLSRSWSSGTRSLNHLVFSSDAIWLAGSDQRGSVTVWDFLTGREAWSIELGELPILSLTFSSDSQRLIGTSASGKVRHWEVARGTLLEERELFLGSQAVLPSSPPNVLWKSAEGHLQLFEPAAGRASTFQRVLFDLRIAAVSEDGRFLAGLDGRSRLGKWTLDGLSAAGEAPFEGEGALLVFSPDGRFLTSADRDSTIRIWTTEPLSLLHDLQDRRLPQFELQTDALPVLRLERAVTGSVRMIAAQDCGDGADLRCVTSDGYIVLRYLVDGEILRLFDSEVEAWSSRPEAVRLGSITLLEHALYVPLRGGVDLAAGDVIEISGIRVTGNPSPYGSGTHRDWRLNPETGGWEQQEFFLHLFEYPELEGQVRVSAQAVPRSAATFAAVSDAVAVAALEKAR